ncbi:MAG: hypothetical protein ACLP5H_26640 [Desulfomonilaceae bacterium]
MSREIQMGLKWVRNLVSHLSTRPVTRKHSETGLKLSISQERELKEEYQRAKAQKDPEICSRIQRLLLVRRGNSEIVTAHTIDVGRMTLQDEAQRCAIHVEEEQKGTTRKRYFPGFPDLKRTMARRFNRFQGYPVAVRTLVPHFP